MQFEDPRKRDTSGMLVMMEGHVMCPACKLTGTHKNAPCEMCCGVGQLHINSVPVEIRAQVASQVVESLKSGCDCPSCKGERSGGKQIHDTKAGKSSEETEGEEEGGFVISFR